MKQPEVNIRILRKEVWVPAQEQKGLFTRDLYHSTDTLQYHDPKDGWKDIPVNYEFISVDKKVTKYANV